MSTHIQIDCPNCRRSLKVRREYIGKNVSCKHCGIAFKIPSPPEGDLPAPAAQETGAAGRDGAELLTLRQNLDKALAELGHQHAENAALREQLVRKSEQDGERGRLHAE